MNISVGDNYWGLVSVPWMSSKLKSWENFVCLNYIILLTQSGHNFALVMTAQLPCHLQKYDVLWSLSFMYEQNEVLHVSEWVIKFNSLYWRADSEVLVVHISFTSYELINILWKRPLYKGVILMNGLKRNDWSERNVMNNSVLSLEILIASNFDKVVIRTAINYLQHYHMWFF